MGWRAGRRSGESRNPETSIRLSPLARRVPLDSGLRRNDEGGQWSCLTHILIISSRERARTPALETPLPRRTVLQPEINT